MSMTEFNIDSPFDLMPDESEKANQHLRLYYRYGADRSLAKISKLPDCEVSLRMLQDYSSKWRWQERIKAQYAIDSQHIQQELVELRVSALQEFGGLLINAIRQADVTDSSLSQISTGLRAFIDGYAVVFDALPTRRTQTMNLNDLSFEDVLNELEKVEK